MLPDWLQDPAAIMVVVMAAAWLIVHWLRIGKPRGAQPGCSRCDHNALGSGTGSGSGSGSGSGPGPVPTAGVRSKQLRVVD